MITPTVHEISEAEARELRRDWQRDALAAAMKAAAGKAAASGTVKVAAARPPADARR